MHFSVPLVPRLFWVYTIDKPFMMILAAINMFWSSFCFHSSYLISMVFQKVNLFSSSLGGGVSHCQQSNNDLCMLLASFGHILWYCIILC